MNQLEDRSSPDWLKPPEEQAGLERYIETVRERFWLILAIVALTTGVSVLYVATATKTYEAEADILITPTDSSNPVYGSLGVIQASVDPLRDMETAARLIATPEVARLTLESLEIEDTPEQLLERVKALPVAQSMIIAVKASASTPEEAKQIADTFARSAVAHRSRLMHEQIDEQLPRLRAEAGDADGGGEASIEAQIAQLQLLRSGPDPTMRVESAAALPTVPVSPRPVLSIFAGIFAGLVLGIGGAFVAQALDPRLRRESQLRRLYRLPILGRIPRQGDRTPDNPLDPRSVSPVIAESYRTLRATLVGTRPRSQEGGKIIFVTGSAPSEGKTTTTLNLAASLAVSGRRVIVIESDLRRPVIGEALGITPPNGGVVSVLLENSTLGESLVRIDTYGPNLEFLLADYEGGWITELFSIPTARDMLEEARRRADVVLIDSPPLNEVVDALPLAQQADEVLLVVRLGVTKLDRLRHLGELLSENDIRPVGFAVVGTPRPKRSEYHYYTASEGRSDSRLQRQVPLSPKRRPPAPQPTRQPANPERPGSRQGKPASAPPPTQRRT